MSPQVDSYRFLDTLSKRMVKSWIAMEQPKPIPWTPLPRPVSECTVALISTAGIALKTDRPFDQEGERRNPWWGDPTYRVIPRTAIEQDVNIYHQHINTSHAAHDLNCVFPLRRLLELESSGEIGRSAPSHYSFMGYLLQPQELLEQSIPAIIDNLKQEQVDVAILVPV